MRSMEEEWGVLMFFAKTSEAPKDDAGDDCEQLCIFGPLAARRGAELKTMSAVEHKHPGRCVDAEGTLKALVRAAGDEDRDGWDIETMRLTDETFSYALGSQGATRRKLAAATGVPGARALRRRFNVSGLSRASTLCVPFAPNR